MRGVRRRPETMRPMGHLGEVESLNLDSIDVDHNSESHHEGSKKGQGHGGEHSEDDQGGVQRQKHHSTDHPQHRSQDHQEQSHRGEDHR